MTSPSKVWRPRSLPYSVQRYLDASEEWIEIARFWHQSDAVEFVRDYPAHLRRVMKGRRSVAIYSGRYIPPGDAVGDRPDGAGTGAPEH